MDAASFRKIRYAVRFLFLATFYFAVFLAFYIGRQQLAPGEIIFYSGLVMIVVALPVSLLLTYALQRLVRAGSPGKKAATGFKFQHIFPAAIVSVLLAYAFVITIPALLDRSISVFIIGVIAHAGDDGLAEEAIHQKFIHSYVEANGTVPKRLKEQLACGNIEHTNGAYRLTHRGWVVYRTNVALVHVLNLSDAYADPH